MSKQYLNGIPYGVSMPYRELTQAEYNALPDSKNNDGIMYFIKNAGVAGGIKMFALADIYDTNEREIGVWIDGKPLYQKCYNITLADGSMGTIDSTFIPQKYEVFMKYNGSTSKDLQKTTFYWGSSNWWTVFIDNGTIMGSVSSYSGKAAILVLQYTKTTDVPGSGSLTPQGTPTHHYSTDEHVIGTWIDGKPLYEKTFVKNNVEVYNGYSFAHGISNLELVIDLKVFMKNSAQYPDNLFIPINADMSANIGFRVNKTYIKATGSNNFGPLSDRYWYFIVQYTKTTD